MPDDMQALAARLTTMERQVARWRRFGIGVLLLALAGTATAFAATDTTVTADRLVLRGNGNRSASLSLSRRGGVELDFSGGMTPAGTSELVIMENGSEVARLGGMVARNAHP